ncbi:MAG: PorT family protein [Candidatus Zixiibacteriota bacterium]|nr:MAG: PorT family protein [candidate division Zixibacteria bacterium]
MKQDVIVWRICLLVLLVSALMLACSVVSAQSTAKIFGQQFQFGFRGGISWAELELEGSPSSGIDSRRALTAGAFWAFPVSSRFAIQPEVTLKHYGNSVYVVLTSPDYPDGYAEGTFSRNLDYIAISSMVRFQPLSQGTVLPCLLAGPRVDFNILAEQGFEDDYYDIPSKKNVTVGVDLGGMVVLNLKIPVFIDIRGSLGLTDVYEVCGVGFQVEGGLVEPACLNVKGNMLSITAGVIFM